MSLKLVAISKVEKNKLIKESEEKVFEKNANQDNFKTEDVYRIIQDNIEDPNPFKKMVALFICSGSRPIELFVKARFEAIDNRWVKQIGLAKKKGGNPEDYSVI